METLAPRSTYDDDELGMTRRLGWVSGLFFGTCMGLFFLFEGLAEGRPAAPVIGAALAAGVAAGALYGLIMPWALRRMARGINDRIYGGDPRLVPPPPENRYSYRLPCGWVRTPRNVVGGVLYLGPGGLRFDPHLRNPARVRESLTMEPLHDVQLALVQTPLPRWMWIWGSRTVPRIQVLCGGQQALFGIPGAADVLTRLQERVATLKRDAPAMGA